MLGFSNNVIICIAIYVLVNGICCSNVGLQENGPLQCGCPQIPDFNETVPLPPVDVAFANFVRWKMLCFTDWLGGEDLFIPRIIPDISFNRTEAVYTMSANLSNIIGIGTETYFTDGRSPLTYASLLNGRFSADFFSNYSLHTITGDFEATGSVIGTLPFVGSGSVSSRLSLTDCAVFASFTIVNGFVNLDDFGTYLKIDSSNFTVTGFTDPSIPSNLMDFMAGDFIPPMQEKYLEAVTSALNSPIFNFLSEAFAETPFLDIVKTPEPPADWSCP